METDLQKPIYVQIHESLSEMISSGKLLPETRIPSERELSKELGVSRMTVRRAITELVNEGLLERRQGAGTFVARPKISYDASELISYDQALRSRGTKIAKQLLEFSEVQASQRLAENLQIEIGQPLYRVVLLHLGNQVPMIIERAFFPCTRCPDLQEYDLEKTSIYDLLTERYGMGPAVIDQTLEAVVAEDIIAKQLRVPDGSPLLLLTRIVRRVKDKLPLQFSEDFLRSDYARIHFSVSRTPEMVAVASNPANNIDPAEEMTRTPELTEGGA